MPLLFVALEFVCNKKNFFQINLKEDLEENLVQDFKFSLIIKSLLKKQPVIWTASRKRVTFSSNWLGLKNLDSMN